MRFENYIMRGAGYAAASSFSFAVKPFFSRALMRSSTFTELSAVTVVSASDPTFFPTTTLETPLTLLSAACTFFEQPPAQTRPDTSRVTVFSSAATSSAVCATPAATGAAMAPAESTAKAAIIVILVFIILLVLGERMIPLA